MQRFQHQFVPSSDGRLFTGPPHVSQKWALITGSDSSSSPTRYSWQECTPQGLALVPSDGGMSGTTAINPIVEPNGNTLNTGDFVKIRQAYFDPQYDEVFFSESPGSSAATVTDMILAQLSAPDANGHYPFFQISETQFNQFTVTPGGITGIALNPPGIVGDMTAGGLKNVFILSKPDDSQDWYIESTFPFAAATDPGTGDLPFAPHIFSTLDFREIDGFSYTVISSTELKIGFQPASITHNGMITNAAQRIVGSKTLQTLIQPLPGNGTATKGNNIVLDGTETPNSFGGFNYVYPELKFTSSNRVVSTIWSDPVAAHWNIRPNSLTTTGTVLSITDDDGGGFSLCWLDSGGKARAHMEKRGSVGNYLAKCELSAHNYPLSAHSLL
jgi:hypothetical protein